MRIEAFLKQSPLFEVSRASRALDRHMARIFQPEELHFQEALVLVAAFFEAPEPVKPSHLAQTLSLSRGNVSHCVSALEAKGFLRRRIDPGDARSFHLVLKPQGKRCAMQVIRTFDQMQRDFEKRVGATELLHAIGVVKHVEQLCAAAAEEGGKG